MESTVRKEMLEPRDPNKNIIPNDIDPNDPADLDRIHLKKSCYSKGLMKAISYTAIAIFVFFWPLTMGGKTDVPFGHLYKFLMNITGVYGLYAVNAMMIGNAGLSFYGKFASKEGSKLYDYYGHDSVFHPFFYSLGAVFTALYTLDANMPGFHAPELIVGASTGGTVIPAIVMGVAFIIPVGAITMPFLLNYGGIDFIGAVMEPFMRPVFKVPGKSAVDALASFVSSSSMAIIITSKLYHSKVYTKREACVIATCFSAVSVGFAVLVIQTAGLGDHFLKVYFSTLVIAFLITIIMVRIPPLSKKQDMFYDGNVQVLSENAEKFHMGLFKRGVDRAAKRAYVAAPLHKEIIASIVDGFGVMPKVLALLAAVGISGLLIAEHTPLFNWLGMAFMPVMQILGVPDAAAIAPAIPVGIAEMFLPVLMIADKVDVLSIQARYFVTAVSMVQIIFFSETIVVMMATRIPIKLKETVICFFERTLIAMPLVAVAMHILF